MFVFSDSIFDMREMTNLDKQLLQTANDSKFKGGAYNKENENFGW